jgi:PTS system D-glucosamine-specific IIC component
MNNVGSAIFDNLPLLFAVGVAIGMAKKEKEVSALSAVIAYFVMNISINAMLQINNKILADRCRRDCGGCRTGGPGRTEYLLCRAG